MFRQFILLVTFTVPVRVYGLANSSIYDPRWNKYLNHQSTLMKDLFADYEESVAPVFGYNPDFVEVAQEFHSPSRWNYSILLYNFKLLAVVEPQEKVTMVVEVSEIWNDPRLVWDPEDYGNVSILHVRQAKVWSPTLMAYDLNELVDFRDQDFRMVALENKGQLYTFVYVLISTNCAMKVSRFPFDSQTCQIKFVAPLFYTEDVQLLNDIYSGIKNETAWSLMGNSEWNVVNLTNRIEMLSYDDSTGNLELAIFEFKLQRNPMYYIYMIIFPSFIINVISIIGVFMRNSDTMSKLNVGLTNIMTMTFILGVMADKIPKTGNIPLLGIYILINLFIMIVAVGVTIGIIELRKFATPRLKKVKSERSRQLLIFIGSPLESVSGYVLGFLTTANFIMMLIFWIIDG